MIYDFVIFDDDVSIHCPDHFFEYCGPYTRYLGFSTAHKNINNFSGHSYSSNFVIRRIFKFIEFFRQKAFPKWSNSILIYDDIALVLILRLLGYQNIYLRITHPKDLERMPASYVKIVHYFLKHCMKDHDIATISPVLKRYYKTKFDIETTLWTSKVKLLTDQTNDQKTNSAVYSGTLIGRGSIENIFIIMDQISQVYGTSKLYILAPEVRQDMQLEISKFNQRRDYAVKLIIGPNKEKIEKIYKISQFGIAFYDVDHNNFLKQNYPLKTLEYLNHSIIPIVNPINAHVDLEKKGFKLITTNFRDPTINRFFERESLSEIVSCNLDVLKRDCELVVDS